MSDLSVTHVTQKVLSYLPVTLEIVTPYPYTKSMNKNGILSIITPTLSGDARFAAEVGMAMRLMRSDVMAGKAELPSWLTAHLDACERCGGDKVWYHRPFDGEWSGPFAKAVCAGGQGWHGCDTCSEVF